MERCARWLLRKQNLWEHAMRGYVRGAINEKKMSMRKELRWLRMLYELALNTQKTGPSVWYKSMSTTSKNVCGNVDNGLYSGSVDRFSSEMCMQMRGRAKDTAV